MNSFAKYPDIATLWSDQNELTADEVRPNHRSGAWTCPTCHNDYNAEIIDMVNGNADCPYCSGRKAIPGKTSFVALHPDLMNEWNWINNYVLVDPDEITEKYSTNVWWICKRNPDHVYELSVSEKILYKKRHRESCPYCKGRRRKKRLF